MPRRGREQLDDQRVFFVTTTTKDFDPVFNSREKLEALRTIVFEAVRRHQARLFGYVLMSNHLHLLVELETGGRGVSAFMRDIKSLSWRTIFPTWPGIWMARFDDVAIYSQDIFVTKLNYIHNNPVKARLVSRPEDYEFSSARVWLTDKTDPNITTDY